MYHPVLKYTYKFKQTNTEKAMMDTLQEPYPCAKSKKIVKSILSINKYIVVVKDFYLNKVYGEIETLWKKSNTWEKSDRK